MERFVADVQDFRSPPVRFCFKRSQEALKEPALMPAAPQTKAQCAHVRLILPPAALHLLLSRFII